MSRSNEDVATRTTGLREVRYRYSSSFPDVLRQLGATVLVSTYHAGKVGAISAAGDHLRFSFHNFDQAMGIAVAAKRLAIGAKGQIWFFDNNPQLAASLEPAGQYDSCYLARSAHITGGIHCHEMAWSADGGSNDELWVVNTLFSCLTTLHPEFSFVPRWRPPFISELAGEDRCHLNGLAMDQGRPRFVTMMAESNTAAGWRPTKSTSGVVMDVASNEVVTRGLAMPHSPRWHGGRLWLLNSGCGTLEAVELADGKRHSVAELPGYTRGLAFTQSLAFVGISRIRETAVFGGVPIAERRDELRCGVAVVALNSGRTLATLEFETGVEEIFDVQVLTHSRCAFLCGPRPDQDDAQDVWIVPPPGAVPQRPATSNDRNATATYRSELTDAAARDVIQQALTSQRTGRTSEAVAAFESITTARPHWPDVWNHLGNALQDSGRQEASIDCYRRAAIADPKFGPALQNLGYVLMAQGYTDEGVAFLRQAQQVQPADVNHVLIATALPVVYESMNDLRERRERLVRDVQKLADERLSIDTTNTLVPTNFFASYQGENDSDLHANLGRIYRGVDLCKGRRIDHAGSRLRIGFLSAYFRDHTIGRLNLGRVQHLPREQFEVVVLSVGQLEDEMAQAFRKAADKYVVVPREVAKARQLIADQKLDILFFTDVGMDALTYTLAFSRMAPVQCTTWGHPVTTGSPTMDFFLSSNLLEIPEANAHYTEKLLRCPTLGTYYYKPRITEACKTRNAFGLNGGKHLYLCPQTLFKYHPEFDSVIAEILKRDVDGELIVIEGRTPNWTRLLKERWSRVMPEVVKRIRWLPALPNQDFLQLLALADVVLDPLHFGGGNTSYEALAVGTPVVTLPGAYLRSRITRALYAKMEFAGAVNAPVESSLFVCGDTEAYIKAAVNFATDSQINDKARRIIADKSDRLFEDQREVDDLATCFKNLVA